MEFGLVPELHQFQADSVRKAEVVNEVNPIPKLDNNQEPKEVLEAQKDKKSEEVQNKEVEIGKFDTYNEVPITNLSFGYNEESKDFFIKVKRGDFEAQYPTDEMMRLKAHLSDVANKANDSKSGFEAS